MTTCYNQNCTRCSRLATFLADIRADRPDYFARPVPAFGAAMPQLLVVGLAPGMHGANKTGRPFTGDHAGILLYETLHKYGFANQPTSAAADDALELLNCRITNAVKCLPPENKPTTAEVNECNSYLAYELANLPSNAVVIALGSIAHKAVIKALGLKQSAYGFGHAAEHELNNFTLVDSYHCSRYNTQTKRLTEAMFHAVFARAQSLINSSARPTEN